MPHGSELEGSCIRQYMRIGHQTALYLHQLHRTAPAGRSVEGRWEQTICESFEQQVRIARQNGLDLALLRQANRLFTARQDALKDRPDQNIFGRLTLASIVELSSGEIQWLRQASWAHGDPWYDLRTLVTEIYPQNRIIAKTLLDFYLGLNSQDTVRLFNCLGLYTIYDALRLYADAAAQPDFDRDTALLQFRETARQLEGFQTTTPIWYKPLNFRPMRRKPVSH